VRSQSPFTAGAAGRSAAKAGVAMMRKSKAAIRRRISVPCVLSKTSPFSWARSYCPENDEKRANTLSGGAWSRFHALEPRREVLVRGVERLLHVVEKVDEGEQQDVGHADLVAADEGLAAEQPIEPAELVLRGSLQPLGRLGDAADT